MRIGLRAFMTLVLVLGVEFAALRSLSPSPPSPVWNAIGINLPIALLLFASLMAGFGRGGSRGWWFGFSLFGWAQLLLGMILLRSHDDSLMPATHQLTLMLSRRYWVTDAEHQFTSLGDIAANPGYGPLLEALYLKANAVMSLVVATAGGLLLHLASIRFGWSSSSPGGTDQLRSDRNNPSMNEDFHRGADR